MLVKETFPMKDNNNKLFSRSKSGGEGRDRKKANATHFVQFSTFFSTTKNFSILKGEMKLTNGEEMKEKSTICQQCSVQCQSDLKKFSSFRNHCFASFSKRNVSEFLFFFISTLHWAIFMFNIFCTEKSINEVTKSFTRKLFSLLWVWRYFWFFFSLKVL